MGVLVRFRRCNAKGDLLPKASSPSHPSPTPAFASSMPAAQLAVFSKMLKISAGLDTLIS